MFNSFGIAENYKTKHKCLVTAVNVHFYYKMHVEIIAYSSRGDRFTFTICSYFRRTGIVVPHNSHVTKSTPTPSYHSNIPKSFDPPLRTKPNYPYPNSHLNNHNKINYLHTISPLPHLTTLSHPNPNKFNTNKQNIT